MDQLFGAVKDLEAKEVQVAVEVALTGPTGHVVVDYRTDHQVLRQVGTRAMIVISSPVTAEFVGSPKPDQGYDVVLVHHSRASTSVPTSIGSVVSKGGSCLLIRTQTIARVEGVVGYANNVTKLVKPNPQVGHSPRLVLFWHGFNLTSADTAQVVVRFTAQTSGDDTPEFT